MLTIRSKYEVWAEDGRPILYVERPTYPVRTLLAYGLALLAAWMVFAVGRAPGLGGLVDLFGYLLAGATFFVVATSARPRRHVTVFRDESRREVLLRVLQDQRIAVLMRTYTVITGSGTVLARLRKHYIHNVFRKRWYVEAPVGRLAALAIEDSVVLSLLRRLLGPLFGVLRTNFILVEAGGSAEGAVWGELNRKFTLLDRYVLDLRADAERRFDRRLALALGIMLDTGENR